MARARDAGAPCDFAHVVSVLATPVQATVRHEGDSLAATVRHEGDRLAAIGDSDEPDPELVALASAVLADEMAARPLTSVSARAGPGR